MSAPAAARPIAHRPAAGRSAGLVSGLRLGLGLGLILGLIPGLVRPCAASFQGPTAGVYGAGLGAGAAVGAERAGFGGTPAALRPGTWGALLHWHRPFGMAELRVLEAGGFRDFRRAGLAASWRQTEADGLWREQVLEARAAWRWGRGAAGFPGSLDAGAALSAWTRAAPGSADVGAEQAWGLLWSPVPGLRAGAMARGLPLGPDPARASGGWRRGWADRGAVWQWGLEARPAPDGSRPRAGGRGGRGPGGQALRLDFRKSGPAEWSALAALALRPHPALEATAGLATAPFRASLGASLSWGGADFHQAWRHHRYLGAGWLASLGLHRAAGD